MDPLVKFLEEDEDETLHSGADVDAFTAELNRDIEGTNCTTQQSSEADTGSGQTTGNVLPHWQTSGDDGIVNFQSHQNAIAEEEKNEHPLQIEQPQNASESENKEEDSSSLPPGRSVHLGPQLPDEQNNLMVSQPMDGIQTGEQLAHMLESDSEPNSEKESQVHTPQNSASVGVESNDQQSLSTRQGSQQTSSMGFSNEQIMPTLNRHPTGAGMSSQQPVPTSNQQSGTTLRINKQVPFGMLLPIIQPQLDKDRAMQLQTLYIKLKKNEVSKDGFVRNMRSIIGDQMLKMAVYKIQTQAARESQSPSSQSQSPLQAPSRQMQIPSTQIPTDDGHSQPGPKVAQGSQMASSNAVAFGQDRRHPAFPMQVINKQQHFPHTSLRPLSNDSQIRPTSHPSMVVNSLRPAAQDTNMMTMPKFDWALSDSKKSQVVSLTQTNSSIAIPQNQNHRPSSVSHVKQEPFDQSNENFDTQSSRVAMIPPTSLMPTTSTPSSVPSQMDNVLSNSRISSLGSPIGSGNSSKLTPKKAVVGQKKPIEAPVSSPPSSKKQKVSGGSMDQSIEHLNDVTAVSGVNLREEEEQLFSGSKEDGRISEASRRVVQEEEERLILQKIPLQKKLVEILAKCGLKSLATDVERCLSFCVEERLRSLISNAIRLSKQRVDMENPRHMTIITSDVRQKIQTINHKAREELEKKQAETEKSQKSNEDSASGVDGDKEKDENRAKAAKANKEEDDKMRATAANVAVRAATGGGDMLSRWQLMIEAKQKQGGGSGTASVSQASKDAASRKTSTGSARNTGENQELDQHDHSAAIVNTAASIRKVGRNQVAIPRIARSITVKDLIAVLEREPRMSKSTLLYRLYNRMINVDEAATAE